MHLPKKFLTLTKLVKVLIVAKWSDSFSQVDPALAKLVKPKVLYHLDPFHVKPGPGAGQSKASVEDKRSNNAKTSFILKLNSFKAHFCTCSFENGPTFAQMGCILSPIQIITIIIVVILAIDHCCSTAGNSFLFPTETQLNLRRGSGKKKKVAAGRNFWIQNVCLSSLANILPLSSWPLSQLEIGRRWSRNISPFVDHWPFGVRWSRYNWPLPPVPDNTRSATPETRAKPVTHVGLGVDGEQRLLFKVEYIIWGIWAKETSFTHSVAKEEGSALRTSCLSF